MGEQIETCCNRGSNHPKPDLCMVCVTSSPVERNGIRHINNPVTAGGGPRLGMAGGGR